MRLFKMQVSDTSLAELLNMGFSATEVRLWGTVPCMHTVQILMAHAFDKSTSSLLIPKPCRPFTPLLECEVYRAGWTLTLH